MDNYYFCHLLSGSRRLEWDRRRSPATPDVKKGHLALERRRLALNERIRRRARAFEKNSKGKALQMSART